MVKVEMKNARKRFLDARNLCPGMSDDMYLLTDYMGKVVNDTVVPEQLVICLILAADDIKNEICSFGIEEFEEFPQNLIERKNFISDNVYSAGY
jgi:hypothetical protein